MQKHLNILKTHCTDYIKTHYVQMLVRTKRILTKNVFSYAPQLSARFYTTYIQHADFLFGPIPDEGRNLNAVIGICTSVYMSV